MADINDNIFLRYCCVQFLISGEAYNWREKAPIARVQFRVRPLIFSSSSLFAPTCTVAFRVPE